MTTAPLTERDFRTLARFRHALRVFLRFSEDAARRAGLTPAQHQLLLAVKGWDGEGLPALSDVAQLLQLRLHSALELVQRAEAGGFVTRETDADDARRSLVALTAKGDRKLAQLSVLHRDELRRFRAEMNEVLRELG